MFLTRVMVLALHSPQQGSISQPSPHVSKAVKVLAPIKGIDSRNVLTQSNPAYCIYAFNILPSTFGMRVRNGYREWQTGITNGQGLHVGSLITFGSDEPGSLDGRLFAVTNEGIWDISLYASTPRLVLDFSKSENGGNISERAGWGVSTHYVSDANKRYIFYADSINGLFEFSSDTQTWKRKSDVVGIDSAKVNFVVSHQRQLWFVERGGTQGWYLPQASISGDAKPFHFGAKFSHGGDLAGIFSWSIDGGEGVNDYLVAISREGDLLTYLGSDPSVADSWSSKGSYYIGAVPAGSQFATESGGELKILSSFGLISMGDLVRSVDGKVTQVLTETLQITTFIRETISAYSKLYGWDVRFLPSSGIYIIKTPKNNRGKYTQYVENVTTSGWGIWRDLPMTSIVDWQGTVYMGTDDMRVATLDSFLDDIRLVPDPKLSRNGVEIDYSILTNFQDFDEPGVFKRAKYVRADYVTGQILSETTKAVYDFNLVEILNFSPDLLVPLGSSWDTAVWGTDDWSSPSLMSSNSLSGSWGVGRRIGIATRGKSSSETYIIGWDLIFDSGNPV